MRWMGGCVGRKPNVQVQKIGSFKTFVTGCHADSYSRLHLRFGSVPRYWLHGQTQQDSGSSIDELCTLVYV
jgi:hypothetical protein